MMCMARLCGDKKREVEMPDAASNLVTKAFASLSLPSPSVSGSSLRSLSLFSKNARQTSAWPHSAATGSIKAVLREGSRDKFMRSGARRASTRKNSGLRAYETISASDMRLSGPRAAARICRSTRNSKTATALVRKAARQARNPGVRVSVM
ncbi:hypothetical protein DFJ73DRAFT_840049 [Zopfochytrium polystomum]|nr:hypothetical protein DFJ73DRAFT_840049 [Zopfochytrium polystomum]